MHEKASLLIDWSKEALFVEGSRGHTDYDQRAETRPADGEPGGAVHRFPGGLPPAGGADPALAARRRAERLPGRPRPPRRPADADPAPQPPGTRRLSPADRLRLRPTGGGGKAAPSSPAAARAFPAAGKRLAGAAGRLAVVRRRPHRPAGSAAALLAAGRARPADPRAGCVRTGPDTAGGSRAPSRGSSTKWRKRTSVLSQETTRIFRRS